jgi:hypothetical protein
VTFPAPPSEVAVLLLAFTVILLLLGLWAEGLMPSSAENEEDS